MNIFDSYIDAGQQLEQPERGLYYSALIEYIAYDREPDISGAAMAIFTAIKPSLELSKRRANSGRRGGKAKASSDFATKQNASKTEANEEANHSFATEQNTKQADGNCEANGQAMSKSNSSSKERLPKGSPKKAASRFSPPTVEEVAQYCKERGNTIDPQHFCDYNAARGWKLKGGASMKDWKAAVRTWERNEWNQPKEVQHGEVDWGIYG